MSLITIYDASADVQTRRKRSVAPWLLPRGPVAPSSEVQSSSVLNKFEKLEREEETKSSPRAPRPPIRSKLVIKEQKLKWGRGDGDEPKRGVASADYRRRSGGQPTKTDSRKEGTLISVTLALARSTRRIQVGAKRRVAQRTKRRSKGGAATGVATIQ